MPDRTWRAHPHYNGYEVSDDGLVRSITRQVTNRWGGSTWITGRVLKTFVRKGGYLGGNISIEGQRINFDVHVMVCETFHGVPADPGLQVRHIDGNKLNNSATNLCWGTPSENGLDVVRHGAHPEANKTHCANGHEFTESNIYRAPSFPRKRKCRACMAEYEARRKPRRYARVG